MAVYCLPRSHDFDPWPLSTISYANLSFYMGMGFVIFQNEILEAKIKDIFHFRIYFHDWQWFRITSQLQFHLFKVVRVDVDIPKSMYKFANFQITHLRDHHR